MDVTFVILAAGLGSRMMSSRPKFFHEIAGKPIIRCVIDLCKSFDNSEIITVTRDELKNNDMFSDSKIAIQKTPKGTADAVVNAVPYIDSEYTIILCGDMPSIQKEHIDQLIEDRSDVSLIAMEVPSNFIYMPYGRVIEEDGKFQKIVEYNDAKEKEKFCPSCNSGVYKIKTNLLKKYISRIKTNEKTNEFYFTDMFNIMAKDKIDISVIRSADYWPFHGINTRQDLSVAEEMEQSKLRLHFMNKGVTLMDPKTTYFSHDTIIENDVFIEPNVVLKNGVIIKSGSVVRAFSHLEDCKIMENVSIGPFARIRGGSIINDGADVGNFVEVKKSIFGKASKAKHLSYIGDAVIGGNSNIGAGTITCNYDGVRKHKTTIGEEVFIGANSTLVAPINIDDKSIVGAGSVINKNVTKNSLAISRADQKVIEGKAESIRKKKKETR